jgi:hypothetical protein
MESGAVSVAAKAANSVGCTRVRQLAEGLALLNGVYKHRGGCIAEPVVLAILHSGYGIDIDHTTQTVGGAHRRVLQSSANDRAVGLKCLSDGIAQNAFTSRYVELNL